MVTRPGATTGALGWVGLLPALPQLSLEAPHLLQGLISLRAAPVLIVSTIATLGSGWKLRRRRFRLARLSTMVRMTGLLAGRGKAQYPYLIFGERQPCWLACSSPGPAQAGIQHPAALAVV